MAARFSATNRTRLPSPVRRGDEVGDGLALAGAGRPLDDEVGAGADRVDGGHLGGVGIEDEVLMVRVGVVRRHSGSWLRTARKRLRVAGQRRDDVVVGERVALGREVGDHRELGVGEVADDQPRVDLEVGDVAAQLAERGEHRVGVEAAAHRGHVLQRLVVDLEALLGAR